MKLLSSILLALFAFFLSGCQYALFLTISKGSTSDNLEFNIAEDLKKGVIVEMIRVFECKNIDKVLPPSSVSIWHSERIEGEITFTKMFKYGVPPARFRNVVDPKPIQNNSCYVCQVYAKDTGGKLRSAIVGFNVDNSYNVLQMTQSELEKIFLY